MEPRVQSGIGLCLWSLVLLGALAAPSASSQPAPPPVTLRVYRAIDSRLLGGSLGDAGTRLGNTNAASAGGVLGYLHTEVIPSLSNMSPDRRFNNIDAIAVFEVNVLNVRRARLFPSNDPQGDASSFGPYMAFNGGQAMPPWARDGIDRYGAYVGVQDQAHNPRHAYPGDWYSFVGICPLSRWVTDEDGHREKPSPCRTMPTLEGICNIPGGKPDGTPLCQYTYTYLGYVPLDDLVGITSKEHPLCKTGRTKRACTDYADFRRNGGDEYSVGPNDSLDCGPKATESGLPFWSGRCDPEKASERIRALTKWSHLTTPESAAKKPDAGRRE
ncbi:MAG: hypothetical protein JOZ54_05080 [Acidobacteria bacterium]|nr:hypothetical protein [Acidobacteriota bacterium]